MKNPSLSPHSIIQPFTPQNMQELASHLICTACIIHLTPPPCPPRPSMPTLRPWVAPFVPSTSHVCNPCPLRPHHSPHPSLHPPHAPAFAPQSTHSHSPSIPSHTCSWAHTPCRIQIHTPCPRACPFMRAPTNTQGPQIRPMHTYLSLPTRACSPAPDTWTLQGRAAVELVTLPTRAHHTLAPKTYT